MKKILLIMGLLALSVLVVSCTQNGTLAGQASGRITAPRCELKANCDAITALNARVASLESDVTELEFMLGDLRGETKLVRIEEYTLCLAKQTGCGRETTSSPSPGCPTGAGGYTSNSCVNTTHVLCTGSPEFDDVVLRCGDGGCIGESPIATCN